MEKEKILIIDEDGFSRVCAAILASEGYAAERLLHDTKQMAGDRVGLVIASYPFGESYSTDLSQINQPVIVLTDHISRDLLSFLEGLDRSYCLMKPLNFEKFVLLVKNIMSGVQTCPGGYSIV